MEVVVEQPNWIEYGCGIIICVANELVEYEYVSDRRRWRAMMNDVTSWVADPPALARLGTMNPDIMKKEIMLI